MLTSVNMTNVFLRRDTVKFGKVYACHKSEANSVSLGI